jgi:hypothetical protein
MYNNNTSISTDWEGDESVYVPWIAPSLQLTITRGAEAASYSYHKINGYPIESRYLGTMSYGIPGGYIWIKRSRITLGPRVEIISEDIQTLTYSTSTYHVVSRTLEPMTVPPNTEQDDYWDVVVCLLDISFKTPIPISITTDVVLITQRWWASGETEELSRSTETRDIEGGGAQYGANTVYASQI